MLPEVNIDMNNSLTSNHHANHSATNINVGLSSQSNPASYDSYSDATTQILNNNQEEKTDVSLLSSCSLSLNKDSISSQKQTESTKLAKPTKTKKKKDHVSFSDRMDLLALAQHKFDEIRRGNRGMIQANENSKQINRLRPCASSSNFFKNKFVEHNNSNSNDTKTTATPNLLSTLLYLCLMMNKVEDMKTLLRKTDNESYNEWKAIFDVMHSPIFHIHERRIQNNRAKLIYERKQVYKKNFEDMKVTLKSKEREVEDIQINANETAKSLGEALNKAIDENIKVKNILVSKHDLEINLNRAIEKAKMLHDQRDELKEELQFMKDKSIPSLQKELIEKEKQISANVKEIETCRIATQQSEIKIEILTKELNDISLKRDLVQTQLLDCMKENEFNTAKSSEEHTNDKVNLANLQTELRLTRQKLEDCHADLTKAKKEHLESISIHDTKLQNANDEITNEKRAVARFSNELDMMRNLLDQTRVDLQKQKQMYEEVNMDMSKEKETESKKQLKLMEIIKSKDTELSQLQSQLKTSRESIHNFNLEHQSSLENALSENKNLKNTIAKLEDHIQKLETKEQTRFETLCQDTSSQITQMQKEMKQSIYVYFEEMPKILQKIIKTSSLKDETHEISLELNDLLQKFEKVQSFCDRTHAVQSQEKVARIKIQESLLSNQSETKDISIMLTEFIRRFETFEKGFTSQLSFEMKQFMEENTAQKLREKAMNVQAVEGTQMNGEVPMIDKDPKKERELKVEEKQCKREQRLSNSKITDSISSSSLKSNSDNVANEAHYYSNTPVDTIVSKKVNDSHDCEKGNHAINMQISNMEELEIKSDSGKEEETAEDNHDDDMNSFSVSTRDSTDVIIENDDDVDVDVDDDDDNIDVVGNGDYNSMSSNKVLANEHDNNEMTKKDDFSEETDSISERNSSALDNDGREKQDNKDNYHLEVGRGVQDLDIMNDSSLDITCKKMAIKNVSMVFIDAMSKIVAPICT